MLQIWFLSVWLEQKLLNQTPTILKGLYLSTPPVTVVVLCSVQLKLTVGAQRWDAKINTWIQGVMVAVVLLDISYDLDLGPQVSQLTFIDYS